MPRNLSGPMMDAVNAPVVYPALFFKGNFATGPVNLWTGYGTFTDTGGDGTVYTGVGYLAGLTAIEEGSTVGARGITVSLSGIDPQIDGLLQGILSEFVLGAPVAVYLGLFDGNGNLVSSPLYPCFVGCMDQPMVDVAATTAIISIACESKLMTLNVVANRRYTNDDQQLDFPGDRGLEFVNGLVETTIYWGAIPNSPNNM
jgi:hypothetical protein